jgi:hypothetical protein
MYYIVYKAKWSIRIKEKPKLIAGITYYNPQKFYMHTMCRSENKVMTWMTCQTTFPGISV